VRPLLVGSMGDAHISAVAHALHHLGVEPELLDLATNVGPYRLGEIQHTLQQDKLARGLIRAMPTYPVGLLSAELHAWSDFVDGVVSNPAIEWLSNLAAIRQADNKLYQLGLAQQGNIAYPKTLVPSTAADIRGYLGETAVLKPLGSGVLDEGTATLPARVFYSTVVDVANLVDEELGRAPVLAQEFIRADLHLRIVTVHQQVWCASLSAQDVAFDWRESPATTQLAWREFEPPTEVIDGALRLAALASIRFSSQDWLEARGRFWFLDLNPVGKWLFLPKGVANAITKAIASWLADSA
jgi:hypothetical protein